MTDAVLKAEAPTLADVEAIVVKRFGSMPTRVYRGDDGSIRVRIKSFTKSARGADPSEHVAGVLTQLAARYVATAAEIRSAAGIGKRAALTPIQDNRHHFEIPGFEDVEIIVHNTSSQDEALQTAHEAIASIATV